MTREEYKKNLTNELSGKSYEELKDYAKEHGVRLYSKVPYKMLSSIVQIMTEREFHGDAFRVKSVKNEMP